MYASTVSQRRQGTEEIRSVVYGSFVLCSIEIVVLHRPITFRPDALPAPGRRGCGDSGRCAGRSRVGRGNELAPDWLATGAFVRFASVRERTSAGARARQGMCGSNGRSVTLDRRTLASARQRGHRDRSSGSSAGCRGGPRRVLHLQTRRARGALAVVPCGSECAADSAEATYRRYQLSAIVFSSRQRERAWRRALAC